MYSENYINSLGVSEHKGLPMRYIIPLLFILAACTTVVDDARVEQFLEIYPEATTASERYSAGDLAFTEEFFSQECDAEPPYKRTVHEQYGARLITYTKDSEIVCAVSKLEPTTLNVKQGDLENAPEGVALTVNGNPVSFEQVQAVYATLPEEQQTLQAINTIIDQLVTQELLAQEAMSYEVDVQEAYTLLLEQSGLTQEEFMSLLEEQGTNKESVLEQIETQLKVQALINGKIGTYEIGDEEAESFYLSNTDSFIVSEQVVFQQVFINTDTRSAQAATTRVETAIRSLNTTDFCTVVKQYSDDEASKDVCGIYTIPRGAVEASIEQVVFNTPPGQLIGVETGTGFHIINVIELRPASVRRYAAVQEEVKNFMVGQVQQLRLNAYLASLRTEAEVISYLTVQ